MHTWILLCVVLFDTILINYIFSLPIFSVQYFSMSDQFLENIVCVCVVICLINVWALVKLLAGRAGVGTFTRPAPNPIGASSMHKDYLLYSWTATSCSHTDDASMDISRISEGDRTPHHVRELASSKLTK